VSAVVRPGGRATVERVSPIKLAIRRRCSGSSTRVVHRDAAASEIRAAIPSAGLGGRIASVHLVILRSGSLDAR
jgi:hypothetical protein